MIKRARKDRVLRLAFCTAATVSMILAVAAGYYAHEVRDARCDTPTLVAAALETYGTKLVLADLSPEREAMFLAVEDPTFRHHHGVDLATPGAGMTTITQGIVKLLYFPDGFRPGIAKIRQTLIAQYALDALISKDQQLRLFLNIAYFGHENGRAIHGFADASRAYFRKEFRQLTDEEFLMLVAMLIGPNELKPHTVENLERVERIHRYLSGDYKPASLLDVEYNGRQSGSLAEEGLMAVLRLLTNAQPE